METAQMAKPGKIDPKAVELKRASTLHPHPDVVTDPLFRGNRFFDARDLLQVRYEMLRRHRDEGVSILDAAAAFGVSRPTFYQLQAAFDQAGLVGLLPKQRGPKGGHKVSVEILDYVTSLKAGEPDLTTVQCIQAIKDRFGTTIHRRSLERAQLRSKKKLPRRK
jgi:transposase